MYTAAVLKEVSVDLLKSVVRNTTDLEQTGFVFKTTNESPLPHHMTINLGDFSPSLNDRSILWKPAELQFNQIVFDKVLGICAAPIIRAKSLDKNGNIGLEVRTCNKRPHVTCCLIPGTKPKMSNDMLEIPTPETVIIDLDQVYILDAVVQVCR